MIKGKIEMPENVQDVLKTAYLCARKFNGHLDVVHVKPDASCILPFPVVSSEMAGFVVSDIVSVEEAVCEKNAVEIEKEFHRFVRDNQVLLKTRPEPDGQPRQCGGKRGLVVACQRFDRFAASEYGANACRRHVFRFKCGFNGNGGCGFAACH